MRERAKRASASETYIFKSYICTWLQSQFPFITYGMALYRQYNDKILTLREKIYDYASERASLENFRICTFYNCYFLYIFCWYLWYFVSEIYIFSGLKLLHLHAVSFYYLWYGAMYKR